VGVRVRLFEGSWYVFINHKNKRRAKKIGTGPEAKKRAEEAARLIQARLAVGDLGVIEQTPQVTLQDYAKTWLEDHVALNLKGGTHRVYQGIFTNHWLPALGSKPLAEITRADIPKIITEKLRHGMSHVTAGHLVTALQSCLTIAEEEEVISKNPLRHHSSWLLKRGGSKAAPKRVEIFTLTQMKEILDWFAQEEPRWHALAMVLARAGMRLGEATALKIRDLDFEDRKIHVERT
jgi:integrase